MDTVLNISGEELTFGELSILEKGLSFVPNRHFDLFETIVDINKFIRNLTVRKYFAKDDNRTPLETPDESAFRLPTMESNQMQEMVALQDLQQLQSDEIDTQVSLDAPKKIQIRNPSFYPVQARSTPMDMFQDKMEQDCYISSVMTVSPNPI